MPDSSAPQNDRPAPSTAFSGSPLEGVEKLAQAINDSRRLRERFLADPHRPGYHFIVPEGVHGPVDPNGAIFYNGRYHLCYIYQHEGKHYWGHASSLDLLHWRHHPPALGPGDGDDGIFSGGAFVDDDGTAVITYWRLGQPDGIAIATSRDEHLDRWQRCPTNPVLPSKVWGWSEMPGPEGEMHVVGTADPSAIWKKDGKYYMLTGNCPVLHEYGLKRQQPQHQGDTLYLFTSDDRVSWRYLHTFYQSRREWTGAGEDDMCPDFFPLPVRPDGGPPSGRHMILFISHCCGCQYYIGRYANDRFEPELHERMSWADNEFFAPESLEAPDGRRIMWAWIFDRRSGEARQAAGWSGEMSLPRTLWLGDDGTLRMAPVQELERLRYNPAELTPDMVIPPDSQKAFVTGDSLELQIDLLPEPGASCGIKVLQSPDGQEETEILYDAWEGKLKIDTTRSSLSDSYKAVEAAPFKLRLGETLRLRVFIDKSIVEVFVNARQALARRAYPTRADSRQVSLFSRNGATTAARTLIWEMMPSNPY